jgi:hypothetical protein
MVAQQNATAYKGTEFGGPKQPKNDLNSSFSSQSSIVIPGEAGYDIERASSAAQIMRAQQNSGGVC